jgi:hypothetical protein
MDMEGLRLIWCMFYRFANCGLINYNQFLGVTGAVNMCVCGEHGGGGRRGTVII